MAVDVIRRRVFPKRGNLFTITNSFLSINHNEKLAFNPGNFEANLYKRASYFLCVFALKTQSSRQ